MSDTKPKFTDQRAAAMYKALTAIVERYEQLKCRDVSNHEFACCVYSAGDVLEEVQGVGALLPERVSIEVFQHDWMPGFAAYLHDGTINETAKAHVILNVGSLLAAVQEKDMDASDLPYMIAESLMHEVIHVLEAWANKEFSEDRVEELLTKYREKYSRNTVWKYTGQEPEVQP